jgi:hypothetical protein
LQAPGYYLINTLQLAIQYRPFPMEIPVTLASLSQRQFGWIGRLRDCGLEVFANPLGMAGMAWGNSHLVPGGSSFSGRSELMFAPKQEQR